MDGKRSPKRGSEVAATLRPEPRGQLEPTSPAYLAWKKARVEAAVEEADAAPEDVVSQDEIWRRFGLDS